MTELTTADRVWNRAAEYEARKMPGDVALSALLRAHGHVMNGGVLHCVETLPESELREALDGYRYFGIEVGPIFERAQGADEEVALEAELDEEYGHVADDDMLLAAFEAHYASHPDAYEPVEG
jgi:hypothetical protein